MRKALGYMIGQTRTDTTPPPVKLKKGHKSQTDEQIQQAIDAIDASGNKPVAREALEKTFWECYDGLPEKMRHELAGAIAKTQARDMAADVVRRALQEPGAPSLRIMQRAVGIDPSQVCRISVGSLEKGPHLHSLVRIALALKKRLVVAFE